MKDLLRNLLGLLPFGAIARAAEPEDPAALHDFLYKQAVALVSFRC